MHKMKSYPFIVLYLFACLFNEEVFAQKPVISSFSPTREKIGSTVIITGNNFSNTTSSNFVYFGDVKARVVTASATSLSVIVPAGAGYKPVSVTVNGLTAYSSLPFSVSLHQDRMRPGSILPGALVLMISALRTWTVTETWILCWCAEATT